MKKIYIVTIIILSLVVGGLVTSWVSSYYKQARSDALFMGAMDAYEKQKVSQAVGLLIESIEINSESYGSYFFLANILNQHPEYQMSCFLYKEALDRAPKERAEDIKHIRNILSSKCVKVK